MIAPGWITDLYIRMDGVDLHGTMAAIEKIIKTQQAILVVNLQVIDGTDRGSHTIAAVGTFKCWSG